MNSASSKAGMAFNGALLLIIIVLGLVLIVQHKSAQTLQHDYQLLLTEKQSAEALARNFIRSTLFLNDLARATSHDNQKRHEESEHRVVVIRKLVEKNDCAVLPVPRAAVEQLRTHRNKIR
ncbi:hypothetical protein [Pantoea sp. ME81]|uniref:hypothetical protein n=1 Tax=Pantoea TaxID=53335 RepID=UPI0015F398A7|nr:hypothetical protein [Pantoea sp. ME81]